MLSYIEKCLSDAEKNSLIKTRDDAFASIRKVGLDDFGEILLGMPNNKYPKISSLLPAMSSPEAQNLWTGNNGYDLLRQSCNFVRSVSFNYNLITGSPISRANILDYGCGYGRLARLMYYFVGTKNLTGVDPWHRSIEECNAVGLTENFIQSDYLPQELPIVQSSFDLAYAFSVFTHLSERATLTALAALRKAVKPGGVLCITIRPPEYWSAGASAAPEDQCESLKQKQISEGFAFFPHNFPPIDGEITYGDAGIEIDWLNIKAEGWSVVRIDRSLEDPMQMIVFMK